MLSGACNRCKGNHAFLKHYPRINKISLSGQLKSLSSPSCSDFLQKQNSFPAQKPHEICMLVRESCRKFETLLLSQVSRNMRDPYNLNDLNFTGLLHLVNFIKLQILETICSKPVDNTFWQSTYNKSVDNLQQTCCQKAACQKPCEPVPILIYIGCL